MRNNSGNLGIGLEMFEVSSVDYNLPALRAESLYVVIFDNHHLPVKVSEMPRLWPHDHLPLLNIIVMDAVVGEEAAGSVDDV